MYGSPPAPSKDLNLPFPPLAGPFSHRKEESDHQRHHHHHHQQQQQQQMSSGLLRYRSAPSSLFGEACEDFLPVRPSSPETETLFARFLTPDLRNEIREKTNAGGGQGSPQFAPPASAAAEHRAAAEVTAQRDGGFSASQMLYHSQQQQQIPSHSSLESPYRVVASMAMEAEHMKGGAGGGGNLIRHSSSPAGLFSHLDVENGYAVVRNMSGFRNGNASIGEGGMPASRLKNQISFSSRQASSAGLMSQISEMGSDGMGGSSPEESSLGSGNAASGRCFIPGFPIASWDDPSLLSDSFSGLKRAREADGKLVTGLNQSEPPQIGELRNNASGLSSPGMTNIEKFLQFQDAVPCKIRAKRGCATHPRSIAERVRRTRISERMRKLQELVPNMDKQTNTADMLELAVDYIKDLQRQVKTISDSRASCTCSSTKQKPYSNPGV